MNKSEFVKELALKADMSNKQAAVVVDAFLITIKDAMKSGEKLSLTGFGIFEGKLRSARKAKNPMNGMTIDIPATKVASFKASKTLKDELNS